MDTQIKFLGLWQLVRIVPVISWSVAGVLTTMLPILFFYQQASPVTVFQTLYLLLGGVGIQGILAHAFNDLMDDHSGTDHITTGILSGGSRVLSAHLFSRHALKTIAFTCLIIALLIDIIFLLAGNMALFTVLLIGIWSAVAYSAPPLRLSYLPFFGEWLCAFISISTLSLTPALLTFHQIPAWAIQNAVLHGLWSLSWLMFHHISDVEADRLAVPVKNTTVVFFERRVPFRGSRKLPAILYLLITAIFTLVIWKERFLGLSVSLCFVVAALWMVITANITDPTQHAKSELKLILLSILNAIWLGCVPFN